MEIKTARPLHERTASAASRRSLGRSCDVIFTFDDVTWDAAQRRGMCFSQDRALLALLEDPRVRRLLVCNRPRSAPVKLVKDLVRRPARFAAGERARLWQPLRLRRNDPTGIADLEGAYRSYDRRLRRAAGRFGLEHPTVITAQPFIAGFADLEWAGPVTLFATDDLAAHPDYRRWREGLLAAYGRVAQRRRRLCAVSTAIVDRVAPLGPALVVPNGVDPGMWLEPGPPPSWWSVLPAPRMLYVGTLDSRLDTDAIRAVARAWPQASVVLVGPMTEPEHLAAVLREPNVVTHGAVPRDEVAALSHAADVCLLPHRRTELTEAMSPLKLFEYLASGSPIVATDLEPVRRAGGRVFRVAPGGDFLAATAAALEAGSIEEGERRRTIADNSWSKRSAEVLDLALRP